jgi:serine/threonine-protein kinase
VLFEMLTGRRAFPGDDVSETLAKVIEREPDFDLLPEATPGAIHRVLRRCLTKDPRRRLADIADVQLDLLEALTTASDGRTAPPPTVRTSGREQFRPWGAGAAIGALAVSLGLWMFAARTDRGNELRRLTMTFPPNAPAALTSQAPGGFAMSPDGSELVYVATVGGARQLYRRALDQLEAQPIPGTQNGVQPVFSPDGAWVAYFSLAADQRPTLKKVSLRGGPPQVLCAVNRPAGGSWGADDTIVFAASQGDSTTWILFRVAAAGGTPEVLAAPNASENQLRFAWPQLLPGGRDVLFSVSTSVASGDADFTEAYVATISLVSRLQPSGADHGRPAHAG